MLIMRDHDHRRIDHRRILKHTAKTAHASYLAATAFDIVKVHEYAAGVMLVLVLMDFIIHYEE